MAGLTERGDRKRDLVVEEHLQHDLSSFTCCLSHILKGRKAAVWTQCSRLRPRTQSGQREGEQLVKSGVVAPPSTRHLRKTSWLYPVALVLNSLLMQHCDCDFWLRLMKHKTLRPTNSFSQTLTFMKTQAEGKPWRFIAVHQVFEARSCAEPGKQNVGRKCTDIFGSLCFCTQAATNLFWKDRQNNCRRHIYPW